MARIAGTDRIDSGNISNHTVVGEKFISSLVTVGMFKRLQTVALAFQRIRWKRLVFKLVTQITTTTAGGYVLGFVQDPQDSVSDITGLMSCRGTVATKWWQSSSITVQLADRLFYTSDGMELREYCPGKIVAMVDGVSSSTGNYVLYADWEVELSVPGLETPLDVSPIIVALHDWSTWDGHIGIYALSMGENGQPAYNGDKDAMATHLEVGGYYKLNNPATVVTKGGNTRSILYVYVSAKDKVLPCYGHMADSDEDVLKANNIICGQGALLLRTNKPAPADNNNRLGEAEPPSSHGLPMTTAALQETLVSLLEKLGVPLPKLSGSSVTSSLEFLDHQEP
jgi:hypothetical protein